jgi:SAM-dependent methyltransferase
MTRTEIIQFLINKTNGKKYIEIGMGPGINFNNIQCEYKICVDPTPTVPVTFRLTSDDFFDQNNETFDIIFIDGLHWSEQVYKDINNSLRVLNDGGFIICHDMNPHSEFIQRYPQPKLESEWTGDCWKAWVKLKTERDDLYMVVVDTDYGCGIIKKGKQKIITIDSELTWEMLENDRIRLLNLISVEDFKKTI